MPSPALARMETFLDGLSLTPARTAALKDRVRQFYAEVGREATLHIRKHLVAARDAQPASAERDARFALMNAALQTALDLDQPGWLTIADGL